MKTSNKILLTALTVFLLFTAASTALYLREYASIKKASRTLFTHLSRTRIRTLVVNKDCPIRVFTNRRKNLQSIGLDGTLDPEKIRIGHDTLYIADCACRYVSLPYLEHYLLDGIPQPIEPQ